MPAPNLPKANWGQFRLSISQRFYFRKGFGLRKKFNPVFKALFFEFYCWIAARSFAPLASGDLCLQNSPQPF